MKSKTSSVRLLKETYDDIDSICDDIGCTRNDWIKEAIDEKLERNQSQDQEAKKDTKTDNSSSKTSEEPVKGIVTKITYDNGKTWTKVNDPDKPRQKVVIDWDEPKPKEPQKITIEIPQDNSKNPPVPFTQFNGKLLPFAKRYNI